jgi:signal transduction histidine kinase
MTGSQRHAGARRSAGQNGAHSAPRWSGVASRLAEEVTSAPDRPVDGEDARERTAVETAMRQLAESLRRAMVEQRDVAVDRARATTVDEERQQIARDLGDVVVRRLFALVLSLESALGVHPEMESELRPLIREVDDIIRATRTVAVGRPPRCPGPAA